DPAGKKPDGLDFVGGLDWSADGKSILTVFKGFAQHWSWDDASKTLRYIQAYWNGPGREMLAAGFADGGSALLAASEIFVGVTDLKAKAAVATLDVRGEPVGRCVASPDGHTLAITTTGDASKLWIFDIRKPDAPLQKVGGLRQTLAFSADGKTFVGVMPDGDKASVIEIWDATTWTSRRDIAYASERTGEIRALALSPD